MPSNIKTLQDPIGGYIQLHLVAEVFSTSGMALVCGSTTSTRQCMSLPCTVNSQRGATRHPRPFLCLEMSTGF
jgi:hypothetical protein